MTPAPVQLRVLRHLAHAEATHAITPTVRELCHAFGWASTQAAQDHLNALERKGLIERAARRARSVRLTRAGRRAAFEVAP